MDEYTKGKLRLMKHISDEISAHLYREMKDYRIKVTMVMDGHTTEWIDESHTTSE